MLISEDSKEYKLFNENKTYDFDEFTFHGNHIKGELLLTHDEYHGSLLITQCNGMDTLQFVQGFPKMYYYENQVLDSKGVKLYEKLDGTCICLYKLYDENNQLIEYVPKTRQKAILEKHFLEMFNLCDIEHITSVDEDIESLYFEMYGILNHHTIKHIKTYIDLALIGAYNGKTFLNDEEINEISQKILIQKPRHIGTIIPKENTYKLELNDKYYEKTQEFNNREENTVDDILGIIKEYLDEINKINVNQKGFIKYEGVVLRNGREYIKSKPQSYFEASGRNVLGVSKQEVKKEIHKILDEKSDLILEKYDERVIIDEININLEEEYDKTDVYNPRVQRMILKQLHFFVETLPSKSLQNTVNDLVEQKPGLKIGEYMKIFADENPLLKHKSRLVYNMILKKIQ